MSKVVAIGLDGVEPRRLRRLVADGRLPALAALQRRAMVAELDHGPGGRTGLAWEHFASGLDPVAAHRASVVEFDPDTYTVWQEGARFRPFWEDLDARVVVFDPPYVDLELAPTTLGVVGWGAHDPGTTFAARPASLADEVPPYPADPWTYAVPWSSPDACRRMGEGLVAGLRARAAAAVHVMRSIPDWDLFLVVAGEPHSATEGLWHGVDESHPASRHPSAGVAGLALDAVYVALDDLVRTVVEEAGPEVTVVAFAMGGMGANDSDVASMVLLSELLHRSETGRPLARFPDAWNALRPHELTIPDGSHWESVMAGCIGEPGSGPRAAARRTLRHLPRPVRERVVALRERTRRRPRPEESGEGRLSLDWMPATRYRHEWPQMRAFALPSFYDGRVRLNVVGREHHGLVEQSHYREACDEIEALLRACRDPRTGAPVVRAIERVADDPLAVRPDQSDLVVVWQGCFSAIEHPVHGVIGPVPFRRTGGHTGPYGALYVAGPGVEAAAGGVRSSYDVAELVRRLLVGEPAVTG